MEDERISRFLCAHSTKKGEVADEFEDKELRPVRSRTLCYHYWEAEDLCDDNLTIFVDKATAIVAGKRTDLIRSKSLSARDFKPFKIRIGK